MHSPVNILKAITLYTLDGWIVGYGNYISIKTVLKKSAMSKNTKAIFYNIRD